MKKWMTTVGIVSAALALTGCAGESRSAEATRMCSELVGPDAFNTAAESDFEDSAAGAKVATVADIEITDEAEDSPTGPFNVLGTAILTTDRGLKHLVEWRCFSQTDGGKTYANLVEWQRVD